jgi:hypothetical protein
MTVFVQIFTAVASQKKAQFNFMYRRSCCKSYAYVPSDILNGKPDDCSQPRWVITDEKGPSTSNSKHFVNAISDSMSEKSESGEKCDNVESITDSTWNKVHCTAKMRHLLDRWE